MIISLHDFMNSVHFFENIRGESIAAMVLNFTVIAFTYTVVTTQLNKFEI